MEQKSHQQPDLLQTFSLHKTKLIVDENNRTECLQIEGQTKSIMNESQAKGNLIQISCKLVLNQTLNECLKKQASLFQIWIKSHKIDVTLSTKQGAYCFEQMNYYMFLQVKTNRATDHVSLIIQNITNLFKRTQIQIKIQIHRQGNLIQQLFKTKQIVLNFGNKDKNQLILSQLHSFKLQSFYSKKKLEDSKDIKNKLKFIDKQFSLPIGVFSHVQQIYQSLNITVNCTLQQIQKMIQQIDNYNSPEMQKQNKLYLCHDMKGGYKEDINFNNNIVPSKQIYNLQYRNFHLEQSEIFNYFSHHNITIPPKHWKILCNRYGTKCLGTFITERQDYDQNVLSSKQFALFLVAVAKKCKFDGYLINIQRKIKNITIFKQWLSYFTTKIHQFIPNSTVIWYDSILPKDGAIKYQNGLSRQNFQFYHLTDGIFTNYWWQEEQLKLSKELKGTNKRKVYIGNDCFGRNTYGGGRFDIFKAANKILQYKNQLSIALFAPGFTYENGGQGNRQMFHLNQAAMYKGINSQMIVLDKWKQSKKDKYSGGWQKQGDWSVSSNHATSHCQKTAILGFPQLQQNQFVRVTFMCFVTSTPPLVDSPYKVILQLLDSAKNVISQTDVHNFNNFKKSTDKVQFVKQQIDASYAQLGNKQISIKVIIMAKSRQNWGGYYGPRFKSQFVTILVYQKQRHWINKIPINQIVIDAPYHSYCNTGVGDYFFNEGLKLQRFYSFLADMDLPHTHIINHPLQTDFNYQHAFYGASSLVVRKQTIKLLKVLIPAGINLEEDYFIQVTVKNTQGINLVFKYLSKNEEQRVFTAKLYKVDDVNDWKKYTFKLLTTTKIVNAPIRSIIQMSSIKFPYHLGQIKIIKGKKRQSQLIKGTLQISKGKIPISQYYFDLTILSKTYKRLYVLLGKVGSFAYFADGVAYLKNIPLQKCQSFEIQIIDTDQCLQYNTLVYKTINSNVICELIFNGSINL